MAASDIEAGKKAAYRIYSQLRREGISYGVGFRAAVEKCHQVCPRVAAAEIEAATWQAIQERVSEELGAPPPLAH